MQQQQQQQPSPHPMAPAAPVPTMTTEQIQRLLDENKQLILAILENQNLGKLSECAQYQSLLQKNLLFLAAIADSQPHAVAVRPQMMPHGAVPPGGGHYMQQQASFPPRASMQLNPLQMQELQQQQQQLHLKSAGMPFPGLMGIGPGTINGMHSMHAEPSHGGNADLRGTPNFGEFPQGSNTVDGRGNKQDSHASLSASEPVGADGQRSSGTEHGGGDAGQTHMRRPEDSKTSRGS